MGTSMIKFIIALFLAFFINTASANSYGLYNSQSQTFELEKGIDIIRSIASITKLFTAYAILNSNVNLYEEIKVSGKSTGRFANGSRIERYELLRAMLMSSDNRSAESLAKAHPGGYDQFLIDVNNHIKKLGLTDTEIVDSTGMMKANRSTIKDLTRFLLVLQDYPLIKYLSSTQQYLVEYTPPNRKKPIKIQLHNTNKFVFKHNEIVLTKTGWTTAAGRCVAMLVEKNGILYSLVTLGNSNVKQRAQIISNMFDNHIAVNSK